MIASLLADGESAKGLGPFLRENWLVLLPPVLGFVAIYLLLPRVRRSKPIAGAVLAIIAMVLGAAVLVRTQTFPIEAILFFAFSGLAIGAAVMMITQKNPVHAALSFALVVLASCGLFLLQAAPFLMAATIIVYAGAIVVTFLFVIMLAQQEGASNADQRSREPFLACLAGCVLLMSLVAILHKTYDTREIDDAIAQLRLLKDAKDDADVKRLLGDPKKTDIANLERPLVSKLKARYVEGPIRTESDNLQISWVRMDVGAVRRNAETILQGIEGRGSLALHNVPGKQPVNDQKAPSHFAPGKLPASNVAAIGRTLFSDYLIPVEMAAVLLLVATIGAIAIAGRKSEELR